jgi:hypothetical protein
MEALAQEACLFARKAAARAVTSERELNDADLRFERAGFEPGLHLFDTR